MNEFQEVIPCSVCKKFPFIFKVKGKLKIMCDHGKQQIGITGYDSPADWNKAQSSNEYRGKPDAK